MIKLSELVDLILLESGQFLLEDLDAANIKLDQFYLMTKRVLSHYEQYRPLEKHLSKVISSNSLTFSEGEGIPEWVSAVQPATGLKGLGFLNNPLNAVFSVGRGYAGQHAWTYDKPVLTCAFAGEVEIVALYKYTVEETKTSDGKVKDVVFPDLNADDTFIQLLTARFLISMGRSRRAFLITDIPVSVDADQLVQEGNELWTLQTERLQDMSKWQLALGG